MVLNGASQAGKGAFNVFLGGMFSAFGVWKVGKASRNFASSGIDLLFGRAIAKTISNFFFDRIFNNWGF